jgi:FlaA1/EpsC-like NDP-sugar epimerase
MSTRISARTIGLLLADGVIIYFAIVVAMHLRLDWDGAAYQLLENNALLKIALATGICVVTIYFYDLYDYAVMNNRREMILRLIQVMGIAWTLLALLFYFVPPLMIGRGTLVYSLFLSLILLLGWRGLIHFLTGHPDLGEKVLILGAGPIATDTARVVTERRDAG